MLCISAHVSKYVSPIPSRPISPAYNQYSNIFVSLSANLHCTSWTRVASFVKLTRGELEHSLKRWNAMVLCKVLESGWNVLPLPIMSNLTSVQLLDFALWCESKDTTVTKRYHASGPPCYTMDCAKTCRQFGGACKAWSENSNCCRCSCSCNYHSRVTIPHQSLFIHTLNFYHIFVHRIWIIYNICLTVC